MPKIILTLFLLTLALSAQSIRFSEAKYYTALDKTLNKKGNIHFAKDSMEIVYDDKSILRYSGDFLVRQKGKKIQKIDLKKKPAMKMFFVLFEAIYFEKKKVLRSYFNMQKVKEIMVLTPKKGVSRYISGVRYKKRKKKLDFLEIHLSNKDRIRIEEIR
jgi:hypothetical protein